MINNQIKFRIQIFISNNNKISDRNATYNSLEAKWNRVDSVYKGTDAMQAAGEQLEWADILRDLELLEEIEVEQKGRRFLLRTEARGVADEFFPDQPPS